MYGDIKVDEKTTLDNLNGVFNVTNKFYPNVCVG
jgi:hypothetical protein